MTKQDKATKDLISPSKYRTPLRGSLYSGPPTRQADTCHVCSIPFSSISFTDISPNKPFVLQILSQLLLPGDPTSTDNDVKWNLWQWPEVKERPCRLCHKTFDEGREKGQAIVLLSWPETEGECKLEFIKVPIMCQELYKCYYSVFVTTSQIDVAIHIL